MRTINISIVDPGDKIFPDLGERFEPALICLADESVQVKIQDSGTHEGRPVVTLRFLAADTLASNGKGEHRICVLRLTGRELQGVCAALRGRFGIIE